MTTFEIHTLESAPEAARDILAATQKSMGAIPNLFGVFAESPAMLQAYTDLAGILEKSTLFEPTELQVVLLSASFENNCEYCVAAHSAISAMQKLDANVVQAIRDDRPIADGKLEALRRFTRAVVKERGFVNDEQVRDFVAAGYTKRHILEVILGVGFKTLSNYVNHVAETPVDAPFRRFAWTSPEAANA